MHLNTSGAGPRRPSSATSGPLTSAAASLAEDGRAALAGPSDPAVVLARLMDLHGSIALARELDALERRTVPPPAPLAAADVRALAEQHLAQLSAAVELLFADPFQRRNKLPDPQAMLALLEQGGALTSPTSRSGRALEAAAERLWEPFGELAARTLGRIRLETRALREEMTPALRALGGGPARLERLDAALASATLKGRERVVGELTRGLERCFSRSLRAAVAALPDEVSVEPIAAWFAPGQWLRRELERMARVVRSVLAHEAAMLLALAEAAGAGDPA